MKAWVSDAAIWAGAVIVLGGLWWAWPPLAVMVAGFAILAWGAYIGVNAHRQADSGKPGHRSDRLD